MPAAGSAAVTLKHGALSFVNKMLALVSHEDIKIAFPGERDMIFLEGLSEYSIELLLCLHMVNLTCDTLINFRLFRKSLAFDLLQTLKEDR